MRGAMLERLKLTNDSVELLAGFEIVERQIHSARANAHHFGGGPHTSCVKHFGKHAPAAIDFANDGIGVDLNAVQFHMCGDSRIDQAGGLHRQARSILIDSEQRQPIGLSSRTRSPRRDNQHVR